MKACPSCESTRGYRYWPDSDGNDPVLTFEPPQPGQKEDGPGYVVVEHVMTDVEWDFTTMIDCLECSESVRAGEVLEPDPVGRNEYVSTLNKLELNVGYARAYAETDNRIEALEEVMRLAITAKNMAARGIR